MGSQWFDSEGVKSDSLKLVDCGILKDKLVETNNEKKLKIKCNGRRGGSTNREYEKRKVKIDE